MKQIVVITGASSGFGALTARSLARSGHTVYAGMRATEGRNAPQVENAKAYSKEHGVDLRTIELDVQSDASVKAAIDRIVAECGRLDVVIHNAGHMSFGLAEAFTPEQFAELYDINVLSTQRVNRAALPQLRKQRRGLLVWISSSSARGGTPPYLSPYFAAKAAMDSLSVRRSGRMIVSRSRHSSARRSSEPLPPPPPPLEGSGGGDVPVTPWDGDELGLPCSTSEPLDRRQEDSSSRIHDEYRRK